MNTLGKILVVLNLLFALVTGGFIVFTYATRFRYDQALKNQQAEARAAKDFLRAQTEVMASLDARYKKATIDLEKVKGDLKDAEDAWNVKKAELENDITIKTKELEEAKINLRVAKEEVLRRNEEVKNLGEALKVREALIIELEGKVRFFQAEAVAQKAKADSLQNRNDNLLAENTRLYRELVKTRTGSGGGTGPVKLPGEPDPPVALVKGTIERVESDLVHLSVGSDHGLAKGNTLEAYRLTPEATYLGMIRVVEVDHRSSIGRLERSSISRRIPLSAGDKVISDLKYR